MCILWGRSTEKFTKFHFTLLRGVLSTVAESPWFSVWKSGSLLDLSGSRMELSGEIGLGEHRLIYSWLDLSTRCAEGVEATQGSHPCNISLRTLKDRPNAAQPGQCFLSFISWPPTPRLQLSHPAVIFFPSPSSPSSGSRWNVWLYLSCDWVSLDLYCSEQERTFEIHQEPI